MQIHLAHHPGRNFPASLTSCGRCPFLETTWMLACIVLGDRSDPGADFAPIFIEILSENCPGFAWILSGNCLNFARILPGNYPDLPGNCPDFARKLPGF